MFYPSVWGDGSVDTGKRLAIVVVVVVVISLGSAAKNEANKEFIST